MQRKAGEKIVFMDVNSHTYGRQSNDVLRYGRKSSVAIQHPATVKELREANEKRTRKRRGKSHVIESRIGRNGDGNSARSRRVFQGPRARAD